MKQNSFKNGILVILGICCCGFTSSPSAWQKISTGINENVINGIAVHPLDNNLIFIGTSKALYRSTDKGQNYKSILQPGGSARNVNDIYIDAHHPQPVFAATDDGVFVSYDKGDAWEKIYESQDPFARRCLTVVADQDSVYVGTRDGLFYKTPANPVWQRAAGEIGNSAIFDLAGDQSCIYAATNTLLYRVDKSLSAKEKIFNLGFQENDNLEEIIDEQELLIASRRIKDVYVLGGNDSSASHLFLASDRGIFQSRDQGETWDRLFTDGLPLEDITSLTAFYEKITSHGQEASFRDIPKYLKGASVNLEGSRPVDAAPQIFAGTSRGVYQQVNNQWHPLYKGIETNNIRFLTHDQASTLYAATDKGIFFKASPPPIPENRLPNPVTIANYKTLTSQFQHEPTIAEVQTLAIDYAEVHPNKIKGWRAGARAKALLPTVSVGIDRADSDLYHWDTGAKPDDLQKGTEYLDWDVSVSWDFADLIWSTDQTSIDSRSKLMVELREDILDQITRLYFERRRIQVELASAQYLDPQLTVDKTLRLEELTALIDALTGGEFSRRIDK